jgi:hypothetical protein
MKHTTCPECGAESAVESVVVAEKIKPPMPTDLDRELGGDGTSDGSQLVKPFKAAPWKIYAGVALVLVLSLLWFVARAKPHDHSAQEKDRLAQISPEPSQQPSPAPTSGQASTPWQASNTDVSPTPGPSVAPSLAPPVGFQDPRLVGAWETKGPWPPGSGQIQTVHWTIETDGHFTFSGPWTDAGAITAADGKMQWFSNNAAEPVDLTYQFNGDVLATHGPLGDAYWWRAKRSTQQSRRSTQREKSRTYVAPDDAAKREILRRMFRHFP